MTVEHTLSKSKYMQGLRSPLKGAFDDANSSGTKLSESEASVNARRAMGDKIGELAKDYFENGVEIAADYTDIEAAEQATKDLIAAGQEVIFEATAINPKNGSFCMLDVLRKVPDSDDEWDMIEVKSSTSVKPDHVEDLTFQRYVFENAGYKIRNCYLMHVDNKYVAGEEIDPQQMFKLEDITSRVDRKFQYVGPKVTELIAHERQEQHIDKEALGEFLDDIEYPVYFLDYETVMNGVPLYEGTCPYQQVPFQFSLHIQEEPGGELTHVSFLHKDTTDPRRDFVETLVNTCGDKGSVVVYFQKFEESRNKELAKAFPEHAAELRAINRRMVDIFKPFQQRWLYDPAQGGSASLKVVLPTYTDISYEDMAIGNGEQALQEYMAFVTGFKTDPEELQELWDGLEEYCKQDTYAMVELLDVLYEKAGYGRGPVPDSNVVPFTGRQP